MRWAVHVRRREEIINSNKILVGTPGDKIPLERSVRKLKDNIEMYLKETASKAVNWFRMGFLGTWSRTVSLQARSQNCEKRLLALSSPSLRPSVRMKQLGSHWTDCHEI